MYPRAFGHYLLLERLGAGGMSEVDLARKAEDQSFVRFLVIKRIRQGNNVDGQFVRMFQDEARINAELSHENIAQVYDFGREGEEFYMAMEYVPGLDLRVVQLSLAEKGELLPRRVSMAILCGVLRALQYAHSRVDQLGRPMNIVHRDVNPRNVMVSVNGEVKLIDFGVAKAADRLEKTEGNAVKGKFAYMAPEQIDGAMAIDGRADLFAVGLMLHELLTGRSPFVGLTEVQILHRVLTGQIPKLPEELRAFQGVHSLALATKAADRYPTADAFRADLERALEPIGGPATPAEIAAVLRNAQGEQVGDIARRLKSYRDNSSPTLRPPVPPLPPDSSGTFNVAPIEEPVQGLGWVGWALGAGAVVLGLLGVLGLGGTAALWWSSRESEPPPAEVVAAPVPVPVAAPVAEPVADPSPVSEPDRPRPTKKREGTAPASTTPAVAPVPAPVPSTAPAPALPVVEEPVPEAEEATGFLLVTSRPSVGLDVYAGGKKVGTTPLKRVRVPAGTYDVTVRDPASGESRTLTVTVRPNQTSDMYVANF